MTERNDSTRDRGDWGADPELRALLRAGDPARSLPPRSSGDHSRLAAAVLALDEAHDPIGHRGSRRSRQPLLIAAAAVVAAGLGGWAISGRGDDSTPVADAPVSTTPSTPTPSGPTVLMVPATVSPRCMAPNVDVLEAQQVAFEGSVTSIDGTTVTLAPSTVYTGAVSDTVQIQAPGSDLVDLLSAVHFEVGRSYLVSASNGQITLCGFSAPDAPDLHTLYEQAFAG